MKAHLYLYGKSIKVSAREPDRPHLTVSFTDRGDLDRLLADPGIERVIDCWMSDDDPFYPADLLLDLINRRGLEIQIL